MSKTQFILVCPDTYEFIYPAMLYSNEQQTHLASNIRDIEGLVGMSNFNLGAKAMALLSVSPKAADQNGGPLEEPVPGVVGRWFNKRIAVLTEGKLFNKLRDQAEGEISAARLASLAPKQSEDEFSSGDFMVDSILDALQEPVTIDEDDIEEAEETVEDKEEFIPKEQEYANISGTVRDYLVKTKQADDDVASGAYILNIDASGCTEKIKAIKALREGSLPDIPSPDLSSLTNAKLFLETATVEPQPLLYPKQCKAADDLVTVLTRLGCRISLTTVHPATVRPTPEPVMKTKTTKTTVKTPAAEEVPDLAAIVDAVL